MKINKYNALRFWEECYGSKQYAEDFHGNLMCKDGYGNNNFSVNYYGQEIYCGGTFIIYCRQLAEEQTQKAICSVLILQRMKKLETESHFGLVNPCIKLNGYTEQEITKSFELSKEFYLWENTFLTTMTESLLIQSQTIWQLTLTAIC